MYERLRCDRVTSLRIPPTRFVKAEFSRRFRQVRPADGLVHLCDTLFVILFTSHSCLHPFISLLTCSIVNLNVIVVVVVDFFDNEL